MTSCSQSSSSSNLPAFPSGAVNSSWARPLSLLLPGPQGTERAVGIGGSWKVLDLSPAGQRDAGGTCVLDLKEGAGLADSGRGLHLPRDQTAEFTSPLTAEFSLLELPGKRRLNAHSWDISKYIRAANLLTLEMNPLVNIF